MMAPAIQIQVEIESFDLYQEVFDGLRGIGVNVLFNEKTWEKDKARICSDAGEKACEWLDQF